MAAIVTALSASASIKVKSGTDGNGDDILSSVRLTGLVPNPDNDKLFAIAQAASPCLVHPMKQVNVTRTTVLIANV